MWYNFGTTLVQLRFFSCTKLGVASFMVFFCYIVEIIVSLQPKIS